MDDGFEYDGIWILDRTKSPCGRFDLTPEEAANLYGKDDNMKVYKISYLDYIQAETMEQAKDILLEQLSMDVQRDDAEAFGIEETDDECTITV